MWAVLKYIRFISTETISTARESTDLKAENISLRSDTPELLFLPSPLRIRRSVGREVAPVSDLMRQQRVDDRVSYWVAKMWHRAASAYQTCEPSWQLGAGGLN
jgi:hypothetical protein